MSNVYPLLAAPSGFSRRPCHLAVGVETEPEVDVNLFRAVSVIINEVLLNDPRFSMVL